MNKHKDSKGENNPAKICGQVHNSVPIELLEWVITFLAAGETLPERYKGRALTGNWIRNRNP